MGWHCELECSDEQRLGTDGRAPLQLVGKRVVRFSSVMMAGCIVKGDDSVKKATRNSSARGGVRCDRTAASIATFGRVGAKQGCAARISGVTCLAGLLPRLLPCRKSSALLMRQPAVEAYYSQVSDITPSEQEFQISKQSSTVRSKRENAGALPSKDFKLFSSKIGKGSEERHALQKAVHCVL